MLNPDQFQSLHQDQRQRLSDAKTTALYAILDEARAEHEAACLVHMLASEDNAEVSLEIQVACSAAADVAQHALLRYVVHGSYYSDQHAEPSAESLHERCRLARNAIDRRIAQVFAGALPLR